MRLHRRGPHLAFADPQKAFGREIPPFCRIPVQITFSLFTFTSYHITITYYNHIRLRIFLLIALLATSVTAFAQRKCGTDIALQKKLSSQPQLQDKLRTMEQSLQRQKRQPGPFRTFSRVTIPVVVHIVLPDPSVVTEAQILGQLATLNLDFLAQNTDVSQVPAVWQSLTGNPEVQFCLAARTPDGDPTNGITRTTSNRDFPIDGAGFEVKYAANGGADAWDSDRYLNIWVCELRENYLGVATFPQLYIPEEQGVVVHYRAFGNTGSARAPFNLGRTLTHEIGHYFHLYHIWGNTDNNSCTDDDNVADTPLQGEHNYDCPEGVLTDGCTPAAPGIMYMNYMDYVNDACMHFFTTGQTDRMRTSLETQRTSLMFSDGCMPVTLLTNDASVISVDRPAGYLCEAAQKPLVVLKNRGSAPLTRATIRYTVGNAAPVSFNWTGNLAPLAQVTVELPRFDAPVGSAVVKAYADLPNGVADEQPANDTATASVTFAHPAAYPVSEGFEGNTFPPAGFTVSNPDRGSTWMRTDYGSGSAHSAVLRNFFYSTNHAIDDLLGPAMGGSGSDSVRLIFDVAAATTTDVSARDNYWDTLEVLVTFDCGKTFVPTGYKKWGATLVTRRVPTTVEFYPTAGEWRKDTVELTHLLKGREFRVVFRNISNWENNVYLDNIRLETRAVHPDLASKGMLIWPNAFRDRFFVEFLQWPDDLRGIAVYDALGREVYRRESLQRSGNRVTIDLVNAANGVYFVKLFYSQQVRTYKIVKAK